MDRARNVECHPDLPQGLALLGRDLLVRWSIGNNTVEIVDSVRLDHPGYCRASLMHDLGLVLVSRNERYLSGGYFVSSGYPNCIEIRKWADFSLVKSVPIDIKAEAIQAIPFQNAFLVTGYEETFSFDLDGNVLSRVEAGEHNSGISLNSDGTMVATASSTQSCVTPFLIDLKNGVLTERFHIDRYAVLPTETAMNTVFLSDGSVATEPRPSATYLSCVRFSPDGRKLAIFEPKDDDELAGYRGTLAVYDVFSAVEDWSVSVYAGAGNTLTSKATGYPGGYFGHLQFSPGGSTIAVPLDNVLHYFEASSGRLNNSIPLAMHGHSIDITADGAHWIIGGSAGLVIVASPPETR
jgi:WD40 repeat protein